MKSSQRIPAPPFANPQSLQQAQLQNMIDMRSLQIAQDMDKTTRRPVIEDSPIFTREKAKRQWPIYAAFWLPVIGLMAWGILR